jgi:hypothetical protein
MLGLTTICVYWIDASRMHMHHSPHHTHPGEQSSVYGTDNRQL